MKLETTDTCPTMCRWYVVERGTSILDGYANAPHVFDTRGIAQAHADHNLKQKRDMEQDLGKRLDWPEYEPISVVHYRQKYGGLTQTTFPFKGTCDEAMRPIAEDIKIINEFLVEIAEQQCEVDVRALLNRIQREITEAM